MDPCVCFFRAFFGSLYRCLGRGARAVFQLYPENNAQRELILSYAMRAGFAGGVVIDYPHRYFLICHFLLKTKHKIGGFMLMFNILAYFDFIKAQRKEKSTLC